MQFWKQLRWNAKSNEARLQEDTFSQDSAPPNWPMTLGTHSIPLPVGKNKDILISFTGRIEANSHRNRKYQAGNLSRRRWDGYECLWQPPRPQNTVGTAVQSTARARVQAQLPHTWQAPWAAAVPLLRLSCFIYRMGSKSLPFIIVVRTEWRNAYKEPYPVLITQLTLSIKVPTIILQQQYKVTTPV